jgi:hypothetical protein
MLATTSSRIVAMGHPLVQSIVLPFLAALAVAGLGRLFPVRARARAIGAAGAIGSLAAFVAILGVPDWPPRGAQQKLAALVLAGILVGAVIEHIPAARRPWVVVAAVLIGAAWIVWPLLGASGADALLAALAFALVVVITGASGTAKDDALARATPPSIAVGALAIIAVAGNAASLGQLAGALAFAGAGYCLWCWLVERERFAASAALGLHGTLALLAVQAIAFVDRISVAAVVLLGLPLAAGAVLDRLGRGPARGSRWHAVALGACAGVLALPAVIAAIALGGSRSPY